MKILMGALSVYVFFKTLYYGIYEFKDNNNKVAGIAISILAVVCLVVPSILVNLRINL